MREARNNLAEVVNQAAYVKEPVYLTRHGRRLVAVVDVEVLERIVELAEDALDIAAADEARRETAAGAEPIPWEQVKRDLGLG